MHSMVVFRTALLVVFTNGISQSMQHQNINEETTPLVGNESSLQYNYETTNPHNNHTRLLFQNVSSNYGTLQYRDVAQNVMEFIHNVRRFRLCSRAFEELFQHQFEERYRPKLERMIGILLHTENQNCYHKWKLLNKLGEIPLIKIKTNASKISKKHWYCLKRWKFLTFLSGIDESSDLPFLAFSLVRLKVDRCVPPTYYELHHSLINRFTVIFNQSGIHSINLNGYSVNISKLHWKLGDIIELILTGKMYNVFGDRLIHEAHSKDIYNDRHICYVFCGSVLMMIIGLNYRLFGQNIPGVLFGALFGCCIMTVLFYINLDYHWQKIDLLLCCCFSSMFIILLILGASCGLLMSRDLQ